MTWTSWKNKTLHQDAQKAVQQAVKRESSNVKGF